jgi:putative Mg2+ transporter-C (MgtC) family protein
MPLTLTWQDIALRLALSVVAGGLLGLDRGEHGRAAGFRTTILVSLAACVAMIQTNLLLLVAGKPPNSFVTMDLMRLPLGILTGVGFIGGGAILRRDNLVYGVTTAATLWFVTVIGLCFGGGQLGLGIGAFTIGMLVLTGMRQLDYHVIQEHHAMLSLTTERDEPTQEAIRAAVETAGFKSTLTSVAYLGETHQREIQFRLRWRGKTHTTDSPAFLGDLSRDPRVVSAEWKLS